LGYAREHLEEFVKERGQDPTLQAELANAAFGLGHITQEIGNKEIPQGTWLVQSADCARTERRPGHRFPSAALKCRPTPPRPHAPRPPPEARAKPHPAKPPLGAEVQNAAKAPLGAEVANAAKAPIGDSASRSSCEPFRDLILAKLDQGLTGQRIYQDLVTDH